MYANALLVFLVMRGMSWAIASDSCEDGECAQMEDGIADDTSAMQAFSKLIGGKQRASVGKNQFVTGPPLQKFKARLMEIRTTRAQDKLMGREPAAEDDGTDWTKIDIIKTENTPDDVTIDDLKAELRALGDLTAQEVKEACPANHFFAGVGEDQATHDVAAHCKSCAANCAQCASETMDECSKCIDPLALIMVREDPSPSFACVEKCPACYSNDNGVCRLDSACMAATDGDVDVPLHGGEAFDADASLEQQAIHNSNSEEDAVLDEMKDQTHEKEAWGLRRRRAVGQRNARRRSVKANRRRRTNRRRAGGGEDHDNESNGERVCTDKIDQIQGELTSWYEDCYLKANIPKQACDGKDDLQRKTLDFKNLANRIKMVSSYPTQLFLQGISYLPIVGGVAGKLRHACKIINDKATTAHTYAGRFYNKTKKLDAPCKKVQEVHGLVSSALTWSQERINTFSENCGCNCLLNLDQVSSALATSAEYRNKCKAALTINFQLPSVWFPTLPNWLDSILEFIADIVRTLREVLDRRRCVDFFWWSVCYSFGDILRSVGWLIGAISWAIESVVFGVINAILSALGLPTIDEIMRWITDLIPLNVDWPFDFPDLNLNWPNIQLPFDFGPLGCVDLSCVSNELTDQFWAAFWR